MAIAHRGDGSNSGTSTQLSIAKASIAGLTDGDVAYILLHKDQASAGSSFSQATGTTGWTQLKENLWSSGGRNHGAALYRKVMTSVAGEPTNWQFDQTINDNWSAIAWAVSGANTTTPEDATTTEIAGQDSANPDPASITTVTANTIIYVAHGSTQLAGGISWGAPSGYTQAEAVMTAGNSAAQLAYKAETTTGAKNPGVFTNTSGDATAEYIVWTIAVAEAAATNTFTAYAAPAQAYGSAPGKS